MVFIFFPINQVKSRRIRHIISVCFNSDRCTQQRQHCEDQQFCNHIISPAFFPQLFCSSSESLLVERDTVHLGWITVSWLLFISLDIASEDLLKSFCLSSTGQVSLSGIHISFSHLDEEHSIESIPVNYLILVF